MQTPANDNQSSSDNLWLVCQCGSGNFCVQYKDGYHWLRCERCNEDWTYIMFENEHGIHD